MYVHREWWWKSMMNAHWNMPLSTYAMLVLEYMYVNLWSLWYDQAPHPTINFLFSNESMYSFVPRNRVQYSDSYRTRYIVRPTAHSAEQVSRKKETNVAFEEQKIKEDDAKAAGKQARDNQEMIVHVQSSLRMYSPDPSRKTTTVCV